MEDHTKNPEHPEPTETEEKASPATPGTPTPPPTEKSNPFEETTKANPDPFEE
jgi:hypothetical protein